MKKMRLVSALGLAVLLLAVVLVGCAESVSSGDPNWTTNETESKVWERENASEKYVRAFEQFGGKTSVKEVVAKITVGDMTQSKAGLVFGLNQYNTDKENPTYEYFIVGVGGQNYGTETADYYISFYQDVSMASLSESSDSQNATGTMYTIEDNTGFDAFNKTNNSATVYVSVVYGDSGATVKIGNSYDKENGVTASSGATLVEKIIDMTAIPAEGGATVSTSYREGGIGAYGMVKPQGTTTKNEYKIEYFKGPVNLAADEE